MQIHKLLNFLLIAFIFLGMPAISPAPSDTERLSNSIEMREHRYKEIRVVYPKAASLWDNLYESQLQSLVESYCLGEIYDYEYDLPTTNLKESSGGVKLWNPKDPSSGRYGNSLYVVTRRTFKLHYRAPLSKKGAERKAVKHRLKIDHPYDASHAILTFLDGHKKFENNETNKIAYYNGGNDNYAGEQAQGYAENFIDIRDFLSHNTEFYRLVQRYKGTIKYVEMMNAFEEFSDEIEIALKRAS